MNKYKNHPGKPEIWFAGEFIQRNPVYAAFLVTAKANTTTLFHVYPDEGMVWYIGHVHLISSANVKIVQRCRCHAEGTLTQVYPEHPKATDSWSYTPPRYSWRDELGLPIRIEELQFDLINEGTSDEDQTIEIYGYETWDILSPSSLVTQLWKQGKEVDDIWVLMPLIEVTETPPDLVAGMIKMPQITTKIKVKKPKYAPDVVGIEFAMIWIPNPDFTQCIVRMEYVEDVVNKIKNDPECKIISETEADYIIEKLWYPNYAFFPEQFLLRKLPNTYGVLITTLKDVSTGLPIAYNALPYRIQLPTGLRCVIKLETV